MLELGRTSEDANAEADARDRPRGQRRRHQAAPRGPAAAGEEDREEGGGGRDRHQGWRRESARHAVESARRGREGQQEEIKETVNQRADEQMAFNAKMRQEMEQARLDREEAKRNAWRRRERMALTLQMKRMNRLLVQHAADQPLPELESEQLATRRGPGLRRALLRAAWSNRPPGVVTR